MFTFIKFDHSFWFGIILLGFSACTPSQYAFSPDPPPLPQLECVAISCSLPFVNGCRWKNAVYNNVGCQMSCGDISCDAPSTPELQSLEQIVNSTSLSWKAVSGPGTIKYKIVREVMGTIGTTTTNTEILNSIDAKLSFGKEHFYSVIALSEFGESAPSSKKSIVPIEPFRIEKNSVGKGNVTIQWKPVLGAIDYEVLTGPSSSTLTLTPTVLSLGTQLITAKVSGVPNGEPLFLQVVAKNPKVTRLSDNILSLIPYDGFQLTSRSAGNGFAKVAWNSLKGALKYRLEYWPINAPNSLSKIENISLQEKMVSGLINGQIYEFRVCGFLGTECIPSSNTLKAQPIAPPTITKLAGYLNRIDLGWTSVSGATGYKVTAVQAADLVVDGPLLNAATTTSSHPLSRAGEMHSFKITATNDNGGEENSPLREGVPLGAFQISSLIPKDTFIEASWTKSLGSTLYRVSYRDENMPEKTLPDTSNLFATLSNMVNGHSVKVSIRGIHSGQDGYVDSDSLTVIPRGPFRLLTATDGFLQVALSWESLGGAQSYEVKLRDISGAALPFSSGGIFTNTTGVLKNLGKEVPYEFSVEAKLKDGTVIVTANKLKAIPFGDFSMTSVVPEIQSVDLTWEEYFPGSTYEVYGWESQNSEAKKIQYPLTDPAAKTIHIDFLKENQKMTFRVVAKIGNHIIPAKADVETLIKGNPIKRFRPALAVRGLQCMVCHAKITSNIVTDFGFGTENFLPHDRLDLKGRRFFTNLGATDESAYSNQRSALQNANLIRGSLIVPKVIVSQSDLAFLIDDGAAAPYPKGISMKNWMLDETGLGAENGDHRSMLEKVSPLINAEKIIEKSKVTITYPTRDEVLSLIPVGEQKRGAVVPVNSEFSKTSSVSGLISVGSVVYNKTSSTIRCYGDVVIQGTLVLQNPTVITDGKGCRLYVTDSVFIQGAIPLKSSVEGKKPTLQITSARSVLMGLSHYGMAGVYPDANRVTDPNNRPAQATGLGQNAFTRFGSRLDDQYNPSRGLVNGVPGEDFFVGLIEEARVVEKIAGIPLIDAGDTNVVNAGSTYPGTTVSGGNHLKVDYEGLLLNAPHIHSRYFGDFKGVIIGEVAFMARNIDENTVNEEFHYDPVFDEAPLLLPLLPREPLSIAD